MGGRVEGHSRCRVPFAEERSERWVSVRAVEHDHMIGVEAELLGSGLSSGEERGDGHEPGRAGICELIRDLLRGVEGVDRGGRRPGAEDAVEHGGERRDVRAEDPDRRPHTHSASRESAREQIDLPDELTIGGGRAAHAVDESDGVEFGAGEVAEEELVDGDLGDLHIGIGTANHEISFDPGRLTTSSDAIQCRTQWHCVPGEWRTSESQTAARYRVLGRPLVE